MVNNFNIPFSDAVDPQGCSCGPDRYLEEACSRDPERTPMQWEGSQPTAGFTSGQPWLPVNPNAWQEGKNAVDELDNPLSSLNLFKSMMELRLNEPTFQFGNTQIEELGGDKVLALGRLKNSQSFSTFITLFYYYYHLYYNYY